VEAGKEKHRIANSTVKEALGLQGILDSDDRVGQVREVIRKLVPKINPTKVSNHCILLRRGIFSSSTTI